MALWQLDRRVVSLAPDAHVLVCKIKNEMLRLPYFLSYYRELGFSDFIFIDNDSNDGTREFLLGEPDCYVFGTSESFGETEGGLSWINGVLNQFCDGCWVLVADADELLVWPGSEGQTIESLTRRFDAAGAEALFTVLLDMYSDKPFGSIGYRRGEPFIDYSPFFDKGPYRLLPLGTFPAQQLYGGVRARLFRAMNPGFQPPTVSKMPLVKWRKRQHFAGSTHCLESAMPVARMRAALLHFKFFDDFRAKCEDETVRREYYESGREYVVLKEALQKSGYGSFFDPRFSVRYTGTDDLTRMGLMNAAAAFAKG